MVERDNLLSLNGIRIITVILLSLAVMSLLWGDQIKITLNKFTIKICESVVFSRYEAISCSEEIHLQGSILLLCLKITCITKWMESHLHMQFTNRMRQSAFENKQLTCSKRYKGALE